MGRLNSKPYKIATVQPIDNVKIKDYQIHLPPLGEGAYGQVYRATYRGLSERALKIFRPGAVDLATMARELEKLSQVAEHPGIVTLHDFDLLSDFPYYAMGLHADQRSDGTWETRTLERLCGHVDHREGWRLLRDIADSLAYLHRHHIVHCDIKPSNILLTDETPLHTKICDFGQSRGNAAEGFQPVGTPLYASPEQLRNPRESSEGRGFRWDVYSFGVVSFKLLTGQLPRLQALAEAERKSFDPDSTLTEASLEATLAESGEPIKGEQLATLTEAVEEITWPSDFYVPSSRKELIEQCLSLDPQDRPADMREVLSRMQEIEQQQVVKRARRLNTIFATLLVVAIWASGFAFVQAQRAKTANEEMIVKKQESDKNADAAFDLMLLFMDELNKGDFSVGSDGEQRLHAIVAENASTFLEKRSKDRQNSTPILRLSAQTASTQGKTALAQGDLDTALKHFTNAYEIRSKLADDANLSSSLGHAAARDLMEIGRIHEANRDYKKAVKAYSEALEWRSHIVSEDGIFSLSQIREFAGPYKALARVYALEGETKLGVTTLDEFLAILDDRIEDGEPADIPGYAIVAISVLELKGAIQFGADDLVGASATYQDMMELAESLDEAPPTIEEEARNNFVKAVHYLGQIQLKQKQPEAALALFRREIELLEEESRRRPYNPDIKVSLAEAFYLASQCLDLTDPTSRSLAIFYLEQAVSLTTSLPSEVRNRPEVQASILRYNDRLSTILEKDE